MSKHSSRTVHVEYSVRSNEGHMLAEDFNEGRRLAFIAMIERAQSRMDAGALDEAAHWLTQARRVLRWEIPAEARKAPYYRWTTYHPKGAVAFELIRTVES